MAQTAGGAASTAATTSAAYDVFLMSAGEIADTFAQNYVPLDNYSEDVQEAIVSGIDVLANYMGTGITFDVTYEECEKERCGFLWLCKRLNWEKQKSKYTCTRSVNGNGTGGPMPVLFLSDGNIEDCRKEAKNHFEQGYL